MVDEKEKDTNAEAVTGHPFDIFESVGKKVVKDLKDSDFSTLDELAAAGFEGIMAIKGVGAGSAKKVMAELAVKGYDVAEKPLIEPERAATIAPTPIANMVERARKLTNPNFKPTPPDKTATRATRNYVKKWPRSSGERDKKRRVIRHPDRKLYNITVHQDINNCDPPLPKDLVEDMVARFETYVGRAPVKKTN